MFVEVIGELIDEAPLDLFRFSDESLDLRGQYFLSAGKSFDFLEIILSLFFFVLAFS